MLIPLKKVDITLRALGLLKDKYDFHFTVIGDGEEREALEALAAEQGIAFEGEKIACELLPDEISLIKMLCDYPATVAAAGEAFAPSMIAAYTYELCKTFNGYYHDHSILREENEAVKKMRLQRYLA